MREASRIVLNGFELTTDVKIVKWPDRYMDKRGVQMWRIVMQLVADAEADAQDFALRVEGGF
jgi:hypothetical protein